MKLPRFENSIEDKMSEFDLWVTPSLGDIRDTEQFVTVMANIQNGMDILSSITNTFGSINECSARKISLQLVDKITSMQSQDASSFLANAISVLFLVTGKTDNNTKCQFPLYLSQQIGIYEFPTVRQNTLTYKQIPRVLCAENIVRVVIQLSRYPQEQQKLLELYFKLILSDEEYSKQLWSIGHSYVQLKQVRSEMSLIASLAIFMSRGSITATTGHDPEEMLRSSMVDWGLVANEDYNTQDISVASLLGEIGVDANVKKRKYDFILPYASRETGAKIFVQCQFYAGDSGSVSHKNVDQTSATRSATKLKFPNAVFIEYLDGAGYYSSLNGDLRRILFLPDTKDFFQIRSAPIKLRRELQEIEFLTPLEVEHAILCVGHDKRNIAKCLLEQGYSRDEIDICLNKSIHNSLLHLVDGLIHIDDSRKPIVRRYCILDSIALYGHPIPADQASGNLLIPGLSVFWGLPQNMLMQVMLTNIPALRNEWKKVEDAFDDLQWLIENKYVISR